MPSEKILAQKEQLVANLTEKLKSSVAGVVVSYKGIGVADDTKLRADLRAAKIEYAVIKNTMLRRAAENADLSGLNDVLTGTTALATSAEDHVAAAKLLAKFAGTHKNFEIKAGFVEGKVIDKAAVESLAKLPAKEVLIAQVLGGLNAPITSFVYVLDANISGLARVLNAIAQQKGA